MTQAFFTRPILNSPYAAPARHWELDASGQPTQNVSEFRRRADFVTPIPQARLQRGGGRVQEALLFDARSTPEQQYDHTAVINDVRREVDRWRALPNSADWRVTSETARLLKHWRHHVFSDVRPFFCQVEAVETAIWLTEVAPQLGKQSERFIAHLAQTNAEANPGLARLGLKLATGAGKTTVMAMLIAWQTVNAVRHPGSKRFTQPRRRGQGLPWRGCQGEEGNDDRVLGARRQPPGNARPLGLRRADRRVGDAARLWKDADRSLRLDACPDAGSRPLKVVIENIIV